MSNWKTETFRATDLTNRIKDRSIKVPHYQRGQVWKTSQKEKLIDSIKNGFPFGTILLYKKDDNTYQLIDGLQRSSTIYEYLHKPAKFFRENDISDDAIEKIYDLLMVQGDDKNAVKRKIINHIKEWVITYNLTMDDVKNISSNNCARYLQSEFPTCTTDAAFEIASILHEEFKTFKSECEDLADAEIPAIIYTGNPDNLPEVFNRINSKGTTLSKYQILSATWTTHEYTLSHPELEAIIQYVDKFYISIIDENFGVDGYDSIDIHHTKRLNLYQILFGFGKLLIDKYPYLFGKSKNDKDIESCGFNLVNSCLGNKNSKIADLPAILKETFVDDKLINDFLVNILHTADSVYKLLKPYLKFKLNKRDNHKEVYHTEFQICSMIANYFNARYATYTFDEQHHNIIGRNIETFCSNSTFDIYKTEFKGNAFKKYLVDIMNDVWKGTGDKRMDDVAINSHYYTDEITKEVLESELDHWINQMNSSRHEFTNVAKPKSAEKLLLSIIYNRSFSAFEQNDEINYDIEHLAPKGCLKLLLKQLPHGEGITNGLPISSFANLCLLREEINRKKKDKTLYQDSQYLNNLEKKKITLEEIENKFSFTHESDLEWVNDHFENFESLKSAYFRFLYLRYERQKRMIINNLFPDEKQIHPIKNETYSSSRINVSQQSNHRTVVKTIPIVRENSNIYFDDIIEKLSGWQKDIFVIINGFSHDYFTLSDVYLWQSKLKELHPDNNTVEAKIRQILQQLRDLGLIEFQQENGKYKRLWR